MTEAATAARVEGSGNIIVQAVGSGINVSIDPNVPHLRLTRFEARTKLVSRTPGEPGRSIAGLAWRTGRCGWRQAGRGFAFGASGAGRRPQTDRGGEGAAQLVGGCQRDAGGAA